MSFALSTRRFLSACLLGGVLLSSFSEARPAGGIIIPPVDCKAQTCHFEWVYELVGGQVVARLKLVCTPNCLPA